jgi:hypothetical protein
MYTKPAMAGAAPSRLKPAAASDVTANELGTPTRNVLSGRATYLGIPRPPVCLIEPHGFKWRRALLIAG